MKNFVELLRLHQINLVCHSSREWEAWLVEISRGGLDRDRRNAIADSPDAAVKKLLEECGLSARVGLLDRLRLWAHKWVRPVGAALLLVTLLSASAMAQQALQPVRVSVAADSDATDVDKEFNSLLREHLGRLNAVRFTSARFDCKVLTASTPITEGGRHTGYAVAVATLTPGERDLRLQLHIETGPNLSELARKMTAYLQREIFPTIERKK